MTITESIIALSSFISSTRDIIIIGIIIWAVKSYPKWEQKRHENKMKELTLERVPARR